MSASIASNVKAKAEDIKTRIQTRVSEMRGGSAGLLGNASEGLFGRTGGILGAREAGGFLKNVAIIQEVKTKGVMTAAKDRISKFRGGSSGLFPSSTSSPIGEKVAVEKDSTIKSIRRRLAIEA